MLYAQLFRQMGWVLSVLCIGLGDAQAAAGLADSRSVELQVRSPELQIFDEVTALVSKKFYDRTFRGLPWESYVQSARLALMQDPSEEKLHSSLNGLLKSLKASHTEFLSYREQSYFGLHSVFSAKLDGAPFEHSGIWFMRANNRWFARNVFPGTPGHRAGIRPGDEILTVNGRVLEPVLSFQTEGKPVTLLIRSREREAPRAVKLTPVYESVQRSMYRATRESRKILKMEGKRIAYIHLWAGTHPSFKKVLHDFAREMESRSDAMVLDLRDGFGGAWTDYIEPFLDVNEEGKPIQQIYTRPLVVIVNEGVRSGKEWLAHVLKTSGRATLIGTTTKGYFLAGEFTEIRPKKYALFLAVSDEVNRLAPIEGKGVSPHLETPMQIPYSRGADPQLEAALKAAAESAQSLK